eukprot:SAG25_NODE_71_length_17290_cov_41.467861_11_plen_125_part_00
MYEFLSQLFFSCNDPVMSAPPPQAKQAAVAQVQSAWPTPTLQELQAAADGWCEVPWASLSAGAKHPQTPPEKMPHRCFDINYLIVLLTSLRACRAALYLAAAISTTPPLYNHSARARLLQCTAG